MSGILPYEALALMSSQRQTNGQVIQWYLAQSLARSLGPAPGCASGRARRIIGAVVLPEVIPQSTGRTVPADFLTCGFVVPADYHPTRWVFAGRLLDGV